MKKLFIAVAALFGVLALQGCSRADLTVFLPNEFWNPDVIEQFNRENNVRVVMQPFDSNERMLELVQGGSHFDIIVPSDYAIEELAAGGFIKALDWSRITTPMSGQWANQLEAYIETFRTQTNPYTNTTFDILQYGAPYSWGTVGIIYNNTNPDVVRRVHEEGFGVFNSNLRTVIYNSSRCSMMAALLATHPGQHLYTASQQQIIDAGNWLNEALRQPNTQRISDEIFEEAADITPNFDAIIAYSGCASIIIRWNPNYSFFNPDYTNVWIDAFTIMDDERTDVDLAYKFISFMLTYQAALDFHADDFLLYTGMREDVVQTMVTRFRNNEDNTLYDRIIKSFLPQTNNPQFFRFDNNRRDWIATAWVAAIAG